MTPLEFHGRAIEIDDLSRVVFPGEGILKGDVLHYYFRIVPTLMPHVRGRILSTVPRAGSGPHIGGERMPSWVREPHVARPDPSALLVVADEPASIAYLLRWGGIDLDMWMGRATTPTLHDRVVFVLAPPDRRPSSMRSTRLAARLVREAVRDAGLTAFVMATGSGALHVQVPISPPSSARSVRDFARVVARQAADEDPRRLATADEASDGHRITIDHRRNAYGRTTLVPYALKSLPGAPVATPLTWREIERSTCCEARTMSSVFARLAEHGGDPWAKMDACSAPLPSRAKPAALAMTADA
jgi:bifunctional non-homologous end joining protein LigD